MASSSRNRSWQWFLTAAAGVALDHLSKSAIICLLPLGSAVTVTAFFNIVHVLNPGAAFSFLANESGWQRWFFSLIAIIASVILVVLLRRKPSALDAASYALILAGAASNLIDRVFRGAVVDWLDFHWRGLHWPAFNLADVWITAGAALLILASFRSTGNKAAQPNTSAQ